MTDQISGEAAEVVTTPPAEAGFSSQEPTARDYEAEARDMGWVPETEWKGDKRPKKFLSAEEFVERGETVIPILRKQLKQAEETFAERLARIEKVNERTVQKLIEDHKKEIASLTAERREAIKSGDVDAVERIEKQIDDLKAEDPTKDAKKPEAAPPTKYVGEDGKPVPKEQAAWIDKNPWYISEFEMYKYATEISQFNAAANPELTFEENIKRVEAAVRKKFPDYFAEGGADEKPAANGHAAVDGGGSFSGAPKTKATLFSKLPAEAKKQAELDVGKGLYKTTEDWAKVYYS